MRVVDLADEFGLTTAETLDLCGFAGVAVAGGGDELTDAEAAAVRQLRLQRAAPPPPPWPTGADPGLAGPARQASPYGVGPAAPHAFDRPAPDPATGGRSGAGSHLAVFGVTASLFGLCVPIIPAAIGIVLGTVAKRRANVAGNAAKVAGPATAAQVLGIVFLVGWIAWFGWSYQSQRMTVTLSDTSEVQVRKVPFTDVTVGECLVIQRQNVVEELWVADCAGPHDAQIVALPAIDPFGGRLDADVVDESCRTEARRHATDEALKASVLAPTRPSRLDVQRGICIIESGDGTPLVGAR